ncbi:MAG: hypothetical protein OEY66_09025 [Gammaproteobacteria bacterium]|nr:hypothetical protein [Gammaproteobacteria bacterium]
MSNDKHKNIPTLEDIVQPGDSPKSDSTDEIKASTTKTENKAELKGSDRRQEDRRKKQEPIAEEKTERRVAERRTTTRRTVDQRRSAEMNELVEKIMQDMMPDLEQHLFMQLRFELQKYIPKILSEFKDKADDE